MKHIQINHPTEQWKKKKNRFEDNISMFGCITLSYNTIVYYYYCYYYHFIKK